MSGTPTGRGRLTAGSADSGHGRGDSAGAARRHGRPGGPPAGFCSPEGRAGLVDRPGLQQRVGRKPGEGGIRPPEGAPVSGRAGLRVLTTPEPWAPMSGRAENGVSGKVSPPIGVSPRWPERSHRGAPKSGAGRWPSGYSAAPEPGQRQRLRIAMGGKLAWCPQMRSHRPPCQSAPCRRRLADPNPSHGGAHRGCPHPVAPGHTSRLGSYEINERPLPRRGWAAHRFG